MRKLTHQPLSRLTLAVFGAVLASSGIAVHASEITDASFPELLPGVDPSEQHRGPVPDGRQLDARLHGPYEVCEVHGRRVGHD